MDKNTDKELNATNNDSIKEAEVTEVKEEKQESEAKKEKSPKEIKQEEKEKKRLEKEERKKKRRRKAKITFYLFLIILIACGYVYFDYNQSNSSLAREVNKATIEVNALVETDADGACPLCEYCQLTDKKEEALISKYDEKAKEDALQEMIDNNEYGKYTWEDWEGKEHNEYREALGGNSNNKTNSTNSNSSNDVYYGCCDNWNGHAPDCKFK